MSVQLYPDSHGPVTPKITGCTTKYGVGDLLSRNDYNAHFLILKITSELYFSYYHMMCLENGFTTVYESTAVDGNTALTLEA